MIGLSMQWTINSFKQKGANMLIFYNLGDVKNVILIKDELFLGNEQ